MTALQELVDSVADCDILPSVVELTAVEAPLAEVDEAAEDFAEAAPVAGVAHHSVEVEFLGQRMMLRTDEDPEHVTQLARHVQDKIDAIVARGHVIAPNKLALLAAINVCDDYFRARNALTAFKAQVADLARTMLAELDEADAELAAEILK